MGFECSNSSCPSYNSCSQIPSITNRKGEDSIDILFAVSATKQDAINKKPLSSATGLIFKNAIKYVESELGRTLVKAYVCVIRTSERNNDNLKCCKENFIQDVKRFNPKLIVAVGQSATSSVLTDNPYSRDVFLANKSIFRKISLDGKSYNFLAMIDTLRSVEDPSILCGVMEDLRRASGVYNYEPMKEAQDRVVPSTIKEVKEVIQHLMHVKTEAIAMDTEDKNLNRRYGNTLDSVQFCYDPKTSYFIWVSHPNTPFDAHEQKIVKKYLHTLFTRDNKNFKYWVMHNAKFDMAILLAQLKARVYNPVICTMTFPFLLEENFVDSITGNFSLKGLSKKFGFKGFGAEELIARNAGRLRNLSSEKFIEYATNDVVATIQLYYILKKMAEGQKTFDYVKKEDGQGIKRIITGNYLEKSMRLMECFYSRVYKLLIEIEYNGIVVDLENLWGLMKADSPINVRVNEILNVDFKKSKAIQKTNQVLADSSSMTESLFDTPWIFDINTVAHKRLLFFDTLKLKPLKAPLMDCPLCKNNVSTRATCTRCRGTGRSKDFDVNGKVDIANRKFVVGSTDRAFQDAYIETCPEISLLDEYSKLKKLQTSYIQSIVKFLDPKNNHKDYYTDLRIRPEFGLMAKTGRARTKNPNSQQIPRGDTPIKKAIKNLFYSPPGYAIVSLDYMAIEVRSWGIISQDKNMAEMFIKAKHHRDLWKQTEDPKEKELATKYGDIHIANASAMYDVPTEKVEKYMRQASKGLTFGSMFGSSMKAMSIGMGCSVEDAEIRRDKAFSKFKEAGKWLDDIEKIAEKDLFVESPLGRRRRLWEFLTKKQGWCSRAKRQARNSPIQGFASDITFIGAALMLQELILKEKKDWSFFNVVHDALYLYVPINEVEECVLRSEEFFTTKLFKILEKDFGFHIPFPLEAEFEIGIYSGDLKKWDFSKTQLKEIVEYLYEVDKKRKKTQKTHKLYNFKGF